MPITLPPITRRRFLAGSLAAGALALLRQPLSGAEVEASAADVTSASSVEPDRFALLSDPHIAADATKVNKDVNMADHLKQVVGEVLWLDKRPAWAMVNGDCAFGLGLAEDYATFLGLLKPLREAGMPVHLTLGNHDDREKFWAAIPPEPGARERVEGRHVLVIESARANWFVLDSLDKTNQTPGVVGEQQIAWLGKALDERAAKPALVMVHHNPVWNSNDPKAKVNGIADTQPFYDAIQTRKHVKALFYGHTHNWQVEKRDGIHLVNFPAVSYPFKAGNPTGWVDARLADGGMTIELRCTDPKHAKHGEKHELEWRGA